MSNKKGEKNKRSQSELIALVGLDNYELLMKLGAISWIPSNFLQ